MSCFENKLRSRNLGRIGVAIEWYRMSSTSDSESDSDTSDLSIFLTDESDKKNYQLRRVEVLEVREVSKEYPMPTGALHVLSDISLSLVPGDSASIVGPSGSGKSTLLYVLGALEPPTAGSVLLGGTNPYTMDEKGLAAFRNEKIGFVFQDHHLLPQLSVLENVLIPTLVAPAADGAVQGEALGAPGTGWAEGPGSPSAARIVRRRKTTGRSGEGPRAKARAGPLRRADGKPRSRVGNGRCVLAARSPPKRRSILIVVTHNLELAARFGFSYRLVDSRLRSD